MMSAYSTLFYFFIYAFLGWCLEVVYTLIRKKEWINRGFLNGPLCPIYGVGVVLIAALVNQCMHALGFKALPVIGFNGGDLDVQGLAVAFILITVVTTLLELVTGAVLEQMFMTKWWDYSSVRFNYKGYICLKFSLAWGFAGTAVLMILHPIIETAVNLIPKASAQFILTGLLFVFTVDMIFTIRALVDFRRLLFELEKITDEYKNAKDKLVNELENIVQELEPPAEKIRGEFEKLNNGVNASKAKLKGEIGKLSGDLVGIRNKLKVQLDALKGSDFLSNGAMREFLSKRLDFENKLKKPIKTNIHEVYDRFNRLSGKLSTNRFFKSFPDMQSEKFQAQIKVMRERYNEARDRMKNKK